MQSISSKPTPMLSKSGLIGWIRSIATDTPHNLKIEDLGTGVIWCKLINIYYPHTIQSNRIISQPKNQYENTNNLKLLQNALVQLKITVPLELNKVAKMKFLENWCLANSLYKHFNANEPTQPINDDSRSNPGQVSVKTPKRTYDMAFNNDQPKKDLQRQLRENSIINNTIFHLPQHHLKTTQPSMSPLKGKWSVSSQYFQNNQYAIIDRVKEILLKPSHDIEKIRQIKILLNIPLEEDIVKIEEDEVNFMIQMPKMEETNHSQKNK